MSAQNNYFSAMKLLALSAQLFKATRKFFEEKIA